MAFNWNQRFDRTGQVLLAHLLWLATSVFFLIGLLNPPAEQTDWIELFLLCCIVFAQVFSLINYRRKPTFNLFLVIAGLCFWSIGFMLRRLAIIDTLCYGVIVGIYLCFVVFNNNKHNPDWLKVLWRK